MRSYANVGADARARKDMPYSLRADLTSRLREAEARYRLPPNVLSRIARVESGFDPRAVSATGDRGLLQLSPYIVRRYGIRDPFDVDQNIAGGARLLREELDASGGDLNQAVRAYNVGRRRALQGAGAAYAERVFGPQTPPGMVRDPQTGRYDAPDFGIPPGEFRWWWPPSWGSALGRIPDAGVPIVIGSLIIGLAVWRAV